MVILQQKQVFSETTVYIWMICHTVLDNHFVQGTTRADFSFHPRLISNLLISAKIRGLNEICVQFLSTKPNWKKCFIVPCGQVIRSQNWKQIRKIPFHCRENLLLLLGIFVLISRLLINRVENSNWMMSSFWEGGLPRLSNRSCRYTLQFLRKFSPALGAALTGQRP